jgi:hypothetical protein
MLEPMSMSFDQSFNIIIAENRSAQSQYLLGRSLRHFRLELLYNQFHA